MSFQCIKAIDVYHPEELPNPPKHMKYFICIGGEKDYQGFLAEDTLSRGEFLDKYREFLDPCLSIIYEDDLIEVRQDAFYPVPGFYIVSYKKRNKKRICDLSYDEYEHGMSVAGTIKNILFKSFSIQETFIYYEEHLLKPSSVHIWVLPIHSLLRSRPAILSEDIWQYLDSFRFSDNKARIIEMNSVVASCIRQEKTLMSGV